MDSTTVCIVLSKELKKKAKEVANQKAISLNALFRLALSEFLERSK